MLDDEETELQNPFPAPPSHYLNYTDHNLSLLALLKSRAEDVNESFEQGEDTDVLLTRQLHILEGQDGIPEWPLLQLEKPRVDWIVEDGSYSVYGDTWFINDKIPSLGQLGGHQLYPEDPTVDRRPALQSILRTLLKSYLDFVRSLLIAPPPIIELEQLPEWQSHAEWLTVMSQNIMSAANELRPVQARVNLEIMMKRQLQLRRDETVAVHRTCDELESRLKELKALATPFVNAQLNVQVPGRTVPSRTTSSGQGVVYPTVNPEDVLKWAESR